RASRPRHCPTSLTKPHKTERTAPEGPPAPEPMPASAVSAALSIPSGKRPPWPQQGTPERPATASQAPESCRITGNLILNPVRQPAIDHDVDAGDEARARAHQEGRGVGDLLGRRHAAPGILGERSLEQVGHVLLDALPDPALEIGV